MNVELAYRERLDAMSVAERIRRAEALFSWSRDYVVRSIVAARGKVSDGEVKCELALRQYGADPATRQLINELRNRATR
jgi:hypothetical protein